MMQTETVTVDKSFGEEYAGRYVFREITRIKRLRIIKKYTKYSPQTGAVVDSDIAAIDAETIRASLKEQPENKPITLERLLSENEGGLPNKLASLFAKTVNSLNGLSPEETKNS
jgi:hypothetical protein